MTKRTLILGIGGQDGSYLADILLEQCCEIHGLYRHSSTGNLRRLAHLDPGDVTLHSGDVLDPASIRRIISEVMPDEIYNEADQDHVGYSCRTSGYSLDITAGAVARLLETVRTICPRARVFQPLSATMFGDAPAPQNEATPFAPASPYACAKVAAYYLVQHYRREYGLFIATAIFFNHDSPRRGPDYLLQRIARGLVAVRRERVEKLTMGNLDGRVDIGYAREYMVAAHAIVQLKGPDDFVIGTGRGVSVEELVKFGVEELSISMDRVEIDTTLMPPGKMPTLVADTEKAGKVFGFSPRMNAMDVLRLLINCRLRNGGSP